MPRKKASAVPTAVRLYVPLAPSYFVSPLLVITRMPFFPFKSWLTAAPNAGIDLGLFQLGLSAGGTLELSHIFGTTASATAAALWVPGVIPLCAGGAACIWLLGVPFKTIPEAFAATWTRQRRLHRYEPHSRKISPNNEADIGATILGQAMAAGLGPFGPPSRLACFREFLLRFRYEQSHLCPGAI